MATLLFLGASVSQRPAIEYAGRTGHRVIAVDGDPNAVAFPLADVALAVDFTDVPNVVKQARPYAIDGVLAISTDRGVVPAASVAEALGLPGIGVEVARRMTDKAAMRERLALADLRQPGHAVVTDATDLRSALDRVGLPAVLKPIDSGGQRGVFAVRTLTEAEASFEETLAYSPRRAAIVETYVEGRELNVLLVMRGGEPSLLSISDRLRPGGRAFGVGWIHSFPSALPSDVIETVRATAFLAVRVLGLRDGIAFPQLIATTEQGVYVVEVAARIAAGQMADLVRFGTGIEPYEIAILQALGRDVPDSVVLPHFVRPLAIRFLTAEPGVLPVGEVASVAGLESVRRAKGVLAAGLYFGPGASIRPLQVDADRLGYVVATGDDPVAALENADAASLLLDVRTVAGGRVRRNRRIRVLAAAAAACALIAFALAGIFAFGDRSALVSSVRVDRLVEPLCGCSHGVARLRFALARRAVVTVRMVTRSGRIVAVLVRDKVVGPGIVRTAWRGLTVSDRPVPDGRYLAEVDFLHLHRLVRLDGQIVVDVRGSPD